MQICWLYRFSPGCWSSSSCKLPEILYLSYQLPSWSELSKLDQAVELLCQGQINAHPPSPYTGLCFPDFNMAGVKVSWDCWYKVIGSCVLSGFWRGHAYKVGCEYVLNLSSTRKTVVKRMYSNYSNFLMELKSFSLFYPWTGIRKCIF